MKAKTYLVAVITVIAAITPALARDHIWHVGDAEMHVIASGADMATPVGRAWLLRLVREAATRLCRNEPLQVDRQACAYTTVANAAAVSHHPFLRLALSEQNGAAIAAR